MRSLKKKGLLSIILIFAVLLSFNLTIFAAVLIGHYRVNSQYRTTPTFPVSSGVLSVTYVLYYGTHPMNPPSGAYVELHLYNVNYRRFLGYQRIPMPPKGTRTSRPLIVAWGRIPQGYYSLTAIPKVAGRQVPFLEYLMEGNIYDGII